MTASRKYMTWPTAFTFLRLCCLPIFWYLMVVSERPVAAGFLLGGLGATDWVDGYLARHLNQISDFGQVFDPVVDRLLFISSLVAILIQGGLPAWFCWAVGIREAVVGLMMVTATMFGMERFSVTILGKRATFALMCAIPWLLVGSADFTGSGIIRFAGWLTGIPGLALSYLTAFLYVPKVRDGLRSGRAHASA